jgi:dTMP kinase
MMKKYLPPGTLALYDDDILKSLQTPNFTLLPDKERKGTYIVIEGIDGSGKTTVSRMLSDKLSIHKKKTILVREPWTLEIKKLLSQNPEVNPVVEAYLFAADRLLLHANIIAKKLKENYIVIGDRSYIASLVYQVIRGADENIVWSLNSFAIRPDLVFLLDIDPDIAWERINNKAKKQLMHLEQRRYLESLRERYLKLSRSPNLPKTITINANKPVNMVVDEIYMKLDEIFGIQGEKGSARTSC